jgi:hypothetical protein
LIPRRIASAGTSQDRSTPPRPPSLGTGKINIFRSRPSGNYAWSGMKSAYRAQAACRLIVYYSRQGMPRSGSHLRNLTQRPVCIPPTRQPVHLAGVCSNLCPCWVKSLWSLYVPETGGIRPTFQRAFSKTTFPGSNPGAPANHCRLSRAFPSCQKSRDTSVG